MDKNFERMLSDRLGMFVHFGLYSGLAGSYRGERTNGFGEWIQRHLEIPIKEYEALAKETFKPDKDWAINLVRSAKAAGFRYIVLTSKHHDGFCLFRTSVDGYNSYDFFGRDLCRELADACRAEGVELGFYYSHALDWHEKNAAGNYTLTRPDEKKTNRNYWDYPDDNIDFEEYFRHKCLPQVREILTGYGEIKCIWFDYPHDITKAQATELRTLVKSLQPNCLINSRIGHGLCDYYSLGDNGLPNTVTAVPTECLITLNDTWAYKEYDHNYKSPEAIIEIVCRTLSTRSTLLLNVGPMPNGALTQETENILSELGEWTSRNREAIYGGITPINAKTIFPWGYAAQDKNSVYLYLKKNTGTVSVSGIESEPVSVRLLGGSDIEYTYTDKTVRIDTANCDYTRPVLKICFESEPEISEKLFVDSTRGSLPVAYASLVKRSEPDSLLPLRHDYEVEAGDFGMNGIARTRTDTIHHWESSDDMLAWEVEFTECGKYAAELICADPSFETYCTDPTTYVPYTLKIGEVANAVESGVSYTYNLNATGHGNMRSVKSAGTFEITEKGVYRVTLSKESDQLGYGLSEIRLTKLG